MSIHSDDTEPEVEEKEQEEEEEVEVDVYQGFTSRSRCGAYFSDTASLSTRTSESAT
jgi:hypothetical protein